ncbi:MAG: hypothetical protein MUF00_15425 [Gemmatimonadaceae bacterium]|jgi:hypothetical protein|nr:hypothetical protein [Gemmatimonadaceae bacterium]
MADQWHEIDVEMTPTANVSSYLKDLQQAYDAMWDEADEQTINVVIELERVARDLLASGAGFRPTGQITTLAFVERMIPLQEKDRADLLKNPIAVTSIEMALLNQVDSRVQLFRERLAEIIGVVREFSFDGFTQSYLEEISRLYLDGHDLAVFIVVRAALEEALKEAIERENLLEELARSSNQARPSSRPDLESMIRFASFQSRLIPQQLKDQATKIRLHGNWAVHARESLLENLQEFRPIQAIRSLSAILKALSESGR